MVSATSSNSYVEPAKATCWALPPITCVPFLGQEASCWRRCREDRANSFKSAWRRLSAGKKEPKARACTIGVISNWPIPRPKNSNSAHQGLWTRGLLIRRHIADGRSRLLHHPVSSRNIHRNAGGGRRPIGGQSRIVCSYREKRVRTPITTRADPGTWVASPRFPGQACSPSAMTGGDPPSRQSAAAKKNGNAKPQQKPTHRHAIIDPLVNPGSPPHRNRGTRSKAHSARSCHRMVILAQGPPGRSTWRARISRKTATVVHRERKNARGAGRTKEWSQRSERRMFAEQVELPRVVITCGRVGLVVPAYLSEVGGLELQGRISMAAMPAM